MQLTEVKNLGSYLYTITRNLIHDHIRTRIFRESNKEFLLHYFTYHDSTQQERMEQKELSEALQEAIGQLPPQLRQVFQLSRFEGLSHEEIGQRLQITPLSSKTYMVRALLALRKKMAGYPDKLLFIAAFVVSADRFLGLIAQQDSLLSGCRWFTLNRWLQKADAFGRTTSEKTLALRNAKAQITYCGSDDPNTSLRDYAHKEWSGLLSSLYLSRWKAFRDETIREMEGQPVLVVDYFQMEKGWSERPDLYAPVSFTPAQQDALIKRVLAE